MSAFRELRRQAHAMATGRGVNYFPHLAKAKKDAVSQERKEQLAERGRNVAEQYYLRNSMSDPSYRTSLSDPSYRSSVIDADSYQYVSAWSKKATPTVAVVEGAAHVATPEFPDPLRHSMMDPSYTAPSPNRRI